MHREMRASASFDFYEEKYTILKAFPFGIVLYQQKIAKIVVS